LKKIWNWIKHRILHKLAHLKPSILLDTLKEHGLALVVIIVGWEIIEDILLPFLFVLLGKHVNPAFYAAVPVAWLLCLHWLAVPVLWSAWIKISCKNVDK